MTYLLALDQGTSSCRSIVFDPSGHTVAMAQKELTQIYPQPGWVEHDALEIWRLQLATAREVLRHVVEGYVETGEPVGSRALTRKLTETLSPATIHAVSSSS